MTDSPTKPAPSPAPIPLRQNSPLRGIGLLLLAGLFFTVSDAASKYLTASMPAMQVTWLRYVVFATIMLALAWRMPGSFRTRRPMLQGLRGLGVVASSILFVLALKFLPIADATATSFVSPLFVTALSIPLLGEKVGWRRWAATLVGLIGVLIVVRPGGQGFQAASVLPLFSALAWAFGLVITRMMSATESPVTTLLYSALSGLLLLCLFLPLYWQPLTGEAVLLGVLIGATSTVAHWLIALAFRHADASLLAPFSYAQLFWASLLGYLVFAALPDVWTVVGAVIIAGSGLYSAHRERVRAREARAAAAAPVP